MKKLQWQWQNAPLVLTLLQCNPLATSVIIRVWLPELGPIQPLGASPDRGSKIHIMNGDYVYSCLMEILAPIASLIREHIQTKSLRPGLIRQKIFVSDGSSGYCASRNYRWEWLPCKKYDVKNILPFRRLNDSGRISVGCKNCCGIFRLK